MQRLRISHLTRYEFGGPVQLEPHRLMLRPREGHDVHIESSLLEISPAGAEVRWHRDTLDNSVALVSFSEMAEQVSFYSEVIIQHYEDAPLTFVTEPYAFNYPFLYDPEDLYTLNPFFQQVYPQDAEAVQQWLELIGLWGTNQSLLAMLSELNRQIQTGFAYNVREEPGVQSPATTLRLRSGSCRDYSALFVEACRQLGIASRFVSGYLYAPSTQSGGGATHAWSEVYVPGTGWKGFDPTSGEVTGSNHIAVAVARHPEKAPPVAGSFVGAGGAIMTVDVRVIRL